MNADFYQYTALTINPVDDLLGDTYEISRTLGNGVTSMVYSLAKTKDNYVNNDLQNCVMKISKRSSFKELFINEINIMKQLQQSNNLNKFELFFENIIDSSPTGNICLLTFLIGSKSVAKKLRILFLLRRS
jgi:serine/threonine protein kinase